MLAFAGTPEQAGLEAMVRRLDEPLRVAIAGRIKAGKSTLLNAFVGERLAATDAGECTRVVTWYANGVAERAWAHPHGAPPRQIRFHRVDGRTVLELGAAAGRRPRPPGRRGVQQPAGPHDPDRHARDRLALDGGVGPHRGGDARGRDRGTDDPGGEAAPVADAVLYLMRHLHSTDVGFLEAFHDRQLAGVTPVNAIGVLSRADEVGAGRIDAIDIAERVAADYRRDPRVRALVQTVLPVAGLLAEAAVGLRERDAAALAALAAGGPAADALLLSAQRFAAPDGREPATSCPPLRAASCSRRWVCPGSGCRWRCCAPGSCTTRSASPASCAGVAGWTPCATRCSPGSPSGATSSRPRRRSGPSSGCWPAARCPARSS